jgi:hypothetical protein
MNGNRLQKLFERLKEIGSLLRKTQWSLVGAFVVGLFVGAGTIVDAAKKVGMFIGVTKSDKQREAEEESRDKLAREFIILMGKRTWLMRTVLIAKTLEYSNLDETKNRYLAVVQEWNTSALYYELMLEKYFGTKAVDEFIKNVRKPIEALHRCLLQIIGARTSLKGTQCPKSSAEQTDNQFAFDKLDEVDEHVRTFGRSILPGR